MPTDDAPPLIATIGLHASASTWVFNVVRELMIAAAGEERVITLYADRLDQLPDETTRASRHVVIKSHHGSEELDAWLAAEQARLFLSIRDPRDACISMTQRFKAPLENTVAWIMNDCDRMMRLATLGHPLLRYEDRFFEDTFAVGRVAQSIGLNPPPEVIEAIFARYQTDQVQAFARKLEELPAERVTMVGAFKMDRVTQILAPHIGDGGSGKWYDLPARSQAELTRLFGPFLDRFGYER